MNRKEKQAQTRAALIEAATRVFAEQGLAAASIDGIADEAGYTKGAFYANFANKEDIYLALLDERFGAELERIDAALAGVDAPTVEAREAASAFMGYALSDPRWPRLFFEFTAYAARNEAFRAKLAQRYRELHARITELYRRWSASFPVPPPIPLEAITTMTFCMASGFIVEQIIDPDIDSGIYPEMLEVFFRGVVSMAVDQARFSTRVGGQPDA